MSKMDGLRAMREARYAEAAKAAKPAAVAKATKKAPPKRAEVERPADDAESADSRLCGHRAISGRMCTREHGHEAKSHRYS